MADEWYVPFELVFMERGFAPGSHYLRAAVPDELYSIPNSFVPVERPDAPGVAEIQGGVLVRLAPGYHPSIPGKLRANGAKPLEEGVLQEIFPRGKARLTKYNEQGEETGIE